VTLGAYRHTQMTADDQPTCGKGLAANAVLPEQLGKLLSAQAEVLERHTKALDLSDPNAQMELDAYTRVARTQRGIATELASLAQQMASYRDLPVARHDMHVMADPNGQAAAFQLFIARERELLELLQRKLREDEQPPR
jgi:hypothetical protein